MVTHHNPASSIKTAQIFRAARKQGDKTQVEVARDLGISQGALSKLEAGILKPDAELWFSFCDLFQLSPDFTFRNGTIDRLTRATIEQGKRVGGFKPLPAKYASLRGIKVRSILPLIMLLSETKNPSKFLTFCKSVEMDPDYFVILDNQVNLLFLEDFFAFLSKEGILKGDRLLNVDLFVRRPEVHGGLSAKYTALGNPELIVRNFVANSNYYDCDFKYSVSKLNSKELRVVIEPQPHLKDLPLSNPEQVAKHFSHYRQHLISGIASLGGAPSAGNHLIGLERVSTRSPESLSVPRHQFRVRTA